MSSGTMVIEGKLFIDGVEYFWYTTGIKTRVLVDSHHCRYGHVRNVGRKKWHCEYYYTKEVYIASSLTKGKSWLIEQFVS